MVYHLLRSYKLLKNYEENTDFLNFCQVVFVLYPSVCVCLYVWYVCAYICISMCACMQVYKEK